MFFSQKNRILEVSKKALLMARKKSEQPEERIPFKEGKQRLEQLIQRGEQISSKMPIDEAAFEAWSTRGFELIEKIWDKTSGHLHTFAGDLVWNDSIRSTVPLLTPIRLEGRIRVLRELLQIVEDELSFESAGEMEAPGNAAPVPTVRMRKVFLVHGRNEEATQKVARFLDGLKLEAILLEEQAYEGRSTLEKFAGHSDVGFAVVLITGDDVGRPKDAPPDGLKPRARQNVIFELGFFLGKLPKGHVCALYENGVELPSNFHGIGYVPYDTAGAWKIRLAHEINTSGITIDFSLIK